MEKIITKSSISISREKILALVEELKEKAKKAGEQRRLEETKKCPECGHFSIFKGYSKRGFFAIREVVGYSGFGWMFSKAHYGELLKGYRWAHFKCTNDKCQCEYKVRD